MKSHKISTLLKVTTHNEQEFQSVARCVDQFSEVSHVRAEFEHSDKDTLKGRATAKACEDCERQKRIYEEKLGVKLSPKNIQDGKQPVVMTVRPMYSSGDGSLTSGLRKNYASLPSAVGPAQSEVSEEETPFGELSFNARVLVEYSVERK